MNAQANSLRASVRSYCTQIGRDPLMVQGAGGNVSWKEQETLWVKASGTWLADAAISDIFVPVDLQHLRIAVDNNDFAVIPTLMSPSSLKPSIETMLHALMPQRVVVHVHAIEVLAHLVRTNCVATFSQVLGHNTRWAMVPYFKPGPNLAQGVHAELQRDPNLNVIFLQSHGVVIGGDTVAEVDQVLNKLCDAFRTKPADFFVPKTKLETAALSQTREFQPIADQMVHQLAQNSEMFHHLSRAWALYPDHVVFLGPRAHTYLNWQDFNDHHKSSPDTSELIFVKDEGVFVKKTFAKAKAVQLRCYYDVLARQGAYAELHQLTAAEVAELLNWDAEQYRQSLAK